MTDLLLRRPCRWRGAGWEGRRSRLRAAAAACLVLILLAAAGASGTAFAAQTVIESIQVQGNTRLTSDAFVYATGIKSGDPYDPALVRQAFRRLWDKGLFDDMKVEAVEGEKGTILLFTVRERPLLVSVEYDKVKALTQANIEDAFKQRGLDLSIGKPVSQKNLWKGSEYIKDLLGAKGYLDPAVTFTKRVISDSSVAVRYNIRQGPRTRIKKIDFVGNEIFSDRKLKATLKDVKQSSIFTKIGGKDLWRPALYEQDAQKILELYRAYGYLDVEMKPPVVEVLRPSEKKAAQNTEAADASAAGEKAGEIGAGEGAPSAPQAEGAAKEKKPKKKRPPKPGAAPPAVKEPKEKRSVYLTVRIKEGPRYTTGTMQVKGNTVFRDAEVLGGIPLRSGMIMNDSALQAGLDRLRSAYSNRGYIYATATRSIARKEGNVADVTIEINEDRAYTLDRLEFEGNTVTRDGVLRREVRLNEGETLSRDKLDVSNYKIQQLGYIKPEADPVIEPILDTDTARVQIKLEEQGLNEIQVGGGYSGTDGLFFQGSYSTRNFLGRGEILSAYLEIGGRRNLYSVSFTEPWFLGKPYLLGFSLFSREEDFAQNQTRNGQGGTVQFGKQIRDFSQFRLLYAYEKVSYVGVTATQNFGSGAATAATAVEVGTDTTIGSLTPSFTYDRVNNPFRPSRGRVLFVASQIAGKLLGGDNTFWKPLFRYTQYFPGWRRTYFGVHLEGGWIVPFAEGATQGGAIEDIPVFERFYLGGEFLGPRVFETRSISPVAYVSRDGAKIVGDRDEIIKFKGRNIFGDPILVKCDPDFDIVNTSRLNSQGEPIEVAGPEDQVCNIVRDRVGGNRFFLAQFEYAFPLANPFTLALFLDAGIPLAESDTVNVDQLRVSAGIEARIYLPVFQAPVRFIFGQALRSQTYDVTNSFQFSIGTSF